MSSKELQKILIQRRTEIGLSHQDVANQSGANISRQFYGMIESGERRPSVEVAKKIGTLLKINWTIFFETKGNERLRNNKVV